MYNIHFFLYLHTSFNMVCHAADMKGGSPMPDTGVLRVLTSQQRATGWRRQVEVEKSLGLEKGATMF